MKKIKGKLWLGFKGECKSKIPCYLIKRKGEDGIFLCDILSKYVNKQIKITVEEEKNNAKTDK